MFEEEKISEGIATWCLNVLLQHILMWDLRLNIWIQYKYVMEKGVGGTT